MLGEAIRRLCDADRVDHIDINFGCPAAKVTRKGGGAAVPAKPNLLARDPSRRRSPRRRRTACPVTIKFRKGLFDSLLTYIETGRIAADEGVAAIALHARTAEQHYAGVADWNAIGELKAAVPEIPVLGNGDIWEAADAVAMMRETGCDGVVVGRGCLGRPWLFRDLVEALNGRPGATVTAARRGVARSMARHASTAGRPPRRGTGDARLPQAHLVVPHRLSRSVARRVAGSPTCRHRRRVGGPDRRDWNPPLPWSKAANAFAAVTPTGRSGLRCPTAISIISTT